MGNSYSTCGAQEGAGQLPRDRRLELLSHERRRFVIEYLREASTPVALADLVRRIADRESEGQPRADPDHQDAVHIALYHCHVPRLADTGVVEHDRDRNTVEPGTNFESVAELCDQLSSTDGLDSQR